MMLFNAFRPSARSAVAGVAVLCTLGLSQPSAAVENADFRFDTTKELAALCAVPTDAAEYLVARQACRAFIEATVQYHDAVSKPGKLKRLVCFPANTTIDDGVGAFNGWATAKAGDAKVLGEPPVVGLMRALAVKYPCKG